MATYKTDPSYPHVIGVWGADIVYHDSANNKYVLDRNGIRNALFSPDNPLGNLEGEIDFIVCFVIDGVDGDHGYVDESLSPRPLRGIIQLPYTLDNTNLLHWGGLISGGVAHEVGHYWLVPGRSRISTDNGEVETPTPNDIYAELNQGLPLPQYPVIARQDAHWSPYIAGDNSVMDAVNHGPYSKTHGIGYLGIKGKYTQTQCIDTVGPEVNVPGLGAVRTHGRYSLLERWMMGDYKRKIPPNKFPWKYYSFSILEPKWTFPVSLQAGIYAELTDGSRWYAGFTGGPHRIAAQKAGKNVSGNIIELPITPFDPYNQIGLRLVQIGKKVLFQTRIWAPMLIHQSQSSRFWRRQQTVTHRSILGDLEAGSTLSASDAHRGWFTLDTATRGKVAKMGLSLRTQGDPAYGLLSAKLYQFKKGEITPISLFDLNEEIPKPGPRRLYNGRLMLPFVHNNQAQQYDENANIRDAPKYTLEAPDKDFAFGGILNLDSCQMVLWAGRAAVNHTLIGKSRRVRFDQVILPWSLPEKNVKQSEPLNNNYKILFCVVAREDRIIVPEMFRGLEQMRIAFEEYFANVTNRRVDSAI